MNKFFKIISGRPKEGYLRECIKPYIFYPQITVCIWAMYMGFTIDIPYSKFMFAFMSVALAWQAGWGMSIERFLKSEKNKNKD
ncbi:hypothetical protein [Clostridium estertheticum]|uniref:hypothetical protein n=1 Tax=Clostridium estertheticum TaxID=238834 RepID=UPI001C7DA590|nr:hypothetical protein [Clostridium estertheticum]MBX4266559.1 hypothetical protein [Clostridium estertheticum]WLC88101.1 hypothetical protein KTC95_19100 [Clostridium estertheticum]